MTATAQPVRRKKLLFTVLLALLALLFLEVCSALVLLANDGAWPSPSRLASARERAALVAGKAVGGAEAERLRQSLERAELAPELAATGEDQTLHPYLGYVQDPAGTKRFWETTPEGFPKVPDPSPDSNGEPSFEVGIFGGSVANGFCFAGRHEFLRLLASSPALAGRKVRLRCFAMGGYKQPQQLMALTQTLSLGQRLDLVINIDGFNEVALPVAENLPVGTNPFYPRWWAGRVSGLESGATLRKVGALEVLKEERAGRLELCRPWPLSSSPTCHLLWKALDRRAAARLVAAEQELAGLVPRRKSFLLRGAPFEAPEPEALYPLLAEHWARNSKLMHQLCLAQGIPYFHFLQPNQYLAGSKPMGGEERAIALDDAQPYKRPAELGYPALVQAGRELRQLGVPFTDLTRLFADHPEPLYGDSCCHYNRTGNRLFAAAIGEVVVAGLAAGDGA